MMEKGKKNYSNKTIFMLLTDTCLSVLQCRMWNGKSQKDKKIICCVLLFPVITNSLYFLHHSL